MMASIPNTRSAPLPAPAAKTAPAGDSTAGGFAVPTSPTPLPGQPCMVAPPVEPVGAVDLLEGLAPRIVAPEGGEDGSGGDGTATARTDKTSTDEGQPETAILVPFVQVAPALQVQPPPAAGGASPIEPAGLPGRMTGTGKKAEPAPDSLDGPQEEEDAPDLKTATDAVVKALLQRKPPSAKEVEARAKAEVTDTAKADATPAKAPAPATVQTATPMPVAEVPQPALSPATQPAPAVDEKVATVEGTSTRDLAIERKLDVTRDGAWLDRLARDIARSASDDTPLRFRLHPQTLGSLHVELQQGERGTAVRLTVETEAARQILTDAQPRLTAEARAQGVRIAETHVDLSGSGRQAPGDQRRQDEARQTPFIRTATGPDHGASARMSRRAGLDRYA